MNVCDHCNFKKHLWKFGSIHWDTEQKISIGKGDKIIICLSYYYIEQSKESMKSCYS